MVSLILHGGASSFSEEKAAAVQKACGEIIKVGYQLLKQGGSALDTVEHLIKLQENNPLFDAGTGSSPNSEGEIEMDAIIVDGHTLNFGAVGGIRNVRNPVAVARMVMDKTRHCFLIGEGAARFAFEQGLEFVPTGELQGKGGKEPMGTVGVLALDLAGNIAAATSTGGAPSKMPGRVGDSPLIGCGTVADNLTGAVSASGLGEPLMKIRMADYVLGLLNGGLDPVTAATQAIRYLEERVAGKGGLICLNNRGEVGYAFNTPNMAIAFIDGSGVERVII